jgi:branched-chain amino acid transport system permease protein
LGAVVCALIAVPAYADAAWLVRASLIWLTAIGVMGQNLLIGYTGLISFGQAGFLAIGAYTFGHLRLAGAPVPIALAGEGGAAAVAGLAVGFPSLRLKGPYLAIATLGFGVAVYQVVANSEWISGGRNGLTVPRLVAPTGMSREVFVYYVYLVILLVFTAATYNLVSSYVGRAWVVIRDSDIAARPWA